MEVIKLSNSEYDQWDNFIPSSPQFSLFAYSWYLESLNIRFEIHVVKDKGTIKGGMILPKDRWGYYINPVLCKYLGLFFSRFDGNQYTIESRKRKVQEALLPVIDQLPSFEYTFHPAFSNWLLFQRHGYKQTTAYTYISDISHSNSYHLFHALNTRLRNKISNARKLDYTIRAIDDFSSILPIIEQTYIAKGGKLPLPAENLTKLIAKLKEKEAIRLTGAFHPDATLYAVLGLFYDQNTAYLILNGTVADLKDKGINEWLIFDGMQWAMDYGIDSFDFEGSMIPAIESFYRQFGGELTPYHKIWKDSKQRHLRNFKQRLT